MDIATPCGCAGDRGLPVLNRLGCLCWTVCCALTCPGRGSGREDAGDARSGEMVSVRGHVSQDGEGGLSRNLPWRDAGLPAVNSAVCELAWAGGAARTSVSSVLLVGAGPAAGTPGVLSRRFAPRLQLLRSSAPAAPEYPRLYGDLGEGHQETVVTRFPGFVRGRSCGLWCPQSLFSSQAAPILFRSFKNFRKQDLKSMTLSPQPSFS